MTKKSNVHPGLKLRRTIRGHQQEVYRMALSPNGQMLASPSDDQTVRIWDINSGKLLRTLEGYESPGCVAWSPDRQVLASGDHRGHIIRLWNPKTGELLRLLKGHTGAIKSIVWSPDGNILASDSMDNTIRLWNTETGKTLKKLTGHRYSVESVAWSPDSRTLCLSSWDHTVRLRNAETGKEIRVFDVPDMVYCVAWSPNGQHIASG